MIYKVGEQRERAQEGKVAVLRSMTRARRVEQRYRGVTAAFGNNGTGHHATRRPNPDPVR